MTLCHSSSPSFWKARLFGSGCDPGHFLSVRPSRSPHEIRAARPDSAPSRLLAPISGHRVPAWQGLHPVLAPDGNWLALTWNDTLDTNLWLLSTTDGKMHALTDFGARRTFIARRVAWSPDNRFIFAAVGEGDADIVFFDGLLR